MAPTAHDSSQIPQPSAGQPCGAAARPGHGRSAAGQVAGPGSWRHGPGLLASAVTFGRVTAVCPDVVWLAARRLQAHKPAPSREPGPGGRWPTTREPRGGMTSPPRRPGAGGRPAGGAVEGGRSAGAGASPPGPPADGVPRPTPWWSSTRSWQACPVGADRADWLEADRLNEQGSEHAGVGDWDAALSLYRQAAGLVPAHAPAWFNMGLIYKRRLQWDQVMGCHEHAAALGAAEGNPAWWNPGIAATAVRRWDAGRNAWRRFGIQVPEGRGELQMDLGPAPVRLDPDGLCEVVWGRAADPARIVVMNVPTPQSGHRGGDVVLHDGAPNG